MLSINQLPNRLPGEKIEMVVRRDLFILFKRLLMLLFLVVLPLVFFYLLIISRADIMNQPVPYALITLGGSAYYLFIWVFFFFSFVDYYLDVWVVTSRRIIDVQQKGFFSRIISEQKLFRVQDVTSEVQGILPTIFKYGNVYIQTAGTKERFFFQEVPEPNKIREKIIELVERNKREMVNEMKVDTV